MPLSHLYSCQILSRDSQSNLNEDLMTFYERGFQQNSTIQVWLRFIIQCCKTHWGQTHACSIAHHEPLSIAYIFYHYTSIIMPLYKKIYIILLDNALQIYVCNQCIWLIKTKMFIEIKLKYEIRKYYL